MCNFVNFLGILAMNLGELTELTLTQTVIIVTGQCQRLPLCMLEEIERP